LIETGVAIDHDFQLSGAELAHAAWMLGAKRNHQRLARDSERVGYREDALDFRQPNRLKQRCHLHAHPTPLYIRRGSPKLNS